MNQISKSSWYNKKCIFFLIFKSSVLLLFFLSSCLTTEAQAEKIIVLNDTSTYTPKIALDIRFTKVNIPRMRACKALGLLTNAIAHIPEKSPRFFWNIETEPSNIKGITNKEDRHVTINLTNVTLRQILDELCAQTGWHYEKSAIGISFIAPTKWVKGD